MTSNNLTKHVWNMKRMKQFLSFANINYKGDTKNRPTDVDGLWELRDKLFILFEAKLYGNDMPTGQRLSLERLADALSQAKPTLLIVAEHNTPPEQEAIDLAACEVARFRYGGRWYDSRRVPVKVMVDTFVGSVLEAGNNFIAVLKQFLPAP